MTWRLATLLGLVFVASCGGTKDGPTGRADPLTTIQGICERWADAACNDEVVRDCVGSSTEVESCLEDQADYCARQLRGGVDFDRELASDCIDDVREAYEDADITASERKNVVLLEEGGCAELKESGTSSGGEGGRGGVSSPRPIEGGDDCDPDTDVCVVTHYCDIVGGVGICRSKADPGDVCCEYDSRYLVTNCNPDSEQVPCKPGSYCGTEGLCVALGTDGADCVDNEQCASGYFCSSDGSCQPLGTDRASCESHAQCAAGFFCSTSFNQCRSFIPVYPELCGDLGAG